MSEKVKEALDAIDSVVVPDALAEDTSTVPEILLDDVHKALSTLKSTADQKVDKEASPEIASLNKQLIEMRSMLGKRLRDIGADESRDEKDFEKEELIERKGLLASSA